MEPRQPGKLEQAAALASLAAITWMSLPPQQQYWMKLAALRFLHRTASRLAWREGHRGMADELSGRDLLRYPVAYRLSRLRDRIGAELEAIRP